MISLYLTATKTSDVILFQNYHHDKGKYTQVAHVYTEFFAFLTGLNTIRNERRRKPVLHEADSTIQNTARRYTVNMARHRDMSGTQCNIFRPQPLQFYREYIEVLTVQLTNQKKLYVYSERYTPQTFK